VLSHTPRFGTFPADFIAPSLPTSAPQPPSGDLWLHEIKHDGFRLIARKDRKRVRLFSRPGNDLTHRFPLIVEALAQLRPRSCIVDEEAVSCGENRIASFDRIRCRHYDHTVFLYAFDLIELDGENLRRDPLEVRKATLVSMIASRARHPIERTHRGGRADRAYAKTSSYQHSCRRTQNHRIMEILRSYRCSSRRFLDRASIRTLRGFNSLEISFQPLNKTKLPHLGNDWSEIAQRLSRYDPRNTYTVNYLWGTTGIGFNIVDADRILGRGVHIGWDLIFRPELIAKFRHCGGDLLDSVDDILPAALAYLALDPNATDVTELERAAELFIAIRTSIRRFSSIDYSNALAIGEVCLVVGWSGDIKQVEKEMLSSKSGSSIGYTIPDNRAQMWLDNLAIPKQAPHPAEAHAFIDFMLRPESAAAPRTETWRVSR
jgi:hypothetical protein